MDLLKPLSVWIYFKFKGHRVTASQSPVSIEARRLPLHDLYHLIQKMLGFTNIHYEPLQWKSVHEGKRRLTGH